MNRKVVGRARPLPATAGPGAPFLGLQWTARRSVPILALLLVITLGCASPQQRAMKQALRDFDAASADCTAYAKKHADQLAAVTKAFYSSQRRWPATVRELARFAAESNLKFDGWVFINITFASIPDGTLAISYDVDCSSFNFGNYKFAKHGLIELKPPR